MVNKDKIEIKHWDNVTKWILGISIFVTLFSFTSPIIFTSTSYSEKFDFSQTGPIGDTMYRKPIYSSSRCFINFFSFLYADKG